MSVITTNQTLPVPRLISSTGDKSQLSDNPEKASRKALHDIYVLRERMPENTGLQLYCK